MCSVPVADVEPLVDDEEVEEEEEEEVCLLPEAVASC
jgi:hypothetical protein